MPPQPLLSQQAAFAKHLFIQGYPLWNPDPCLLPQPRQSVGVRIGDVGAVDERGRFDFFFNILDSLPPNFPPFEEDHFRYSGEDLVPRQVVSSPKTPWVVQEVDSEASRRATQYGADLSEDGSHIILPQGAQSFELGLHHRWIFENYAREHGAQWLERFRDRLGWLRSDSIYLVTGFYKTCSWSIASFGMRSGANTDPIPTYCILVEENEQTVRENSVWQPAGRFDHKIGPPSDRRGNHNQTIFIRAITITPKISKQDPSERAAQLFGNLFPLPWSLNLSAGGSNPETPKSNVTIQHVPQISQASHPSEIINKYLLKKEPSAKIAVTHDSQWIAMLKLLEGGQSWTLEDLENHLEELLPKHHSIVTHREAVVLIDLPDLTKTLLQESRQLVTYNKLKISGFTTVYHCRCAPHGEVAVKVMDSFGVVDQARSFEFLRRVERELEIWRRLDHPNILSLLGTAQGTDFDSGHPCMVSMWMSNGTLAEYVNQNVLSLPARIQLITGSAAGLEYLHSKSIVHGDIHPGNILIDSDHNPRLTDFGCSQTLDPLDDLTYLRTNSIHYGAWVWTAPELLYPSVVDAYIKPNLNVDIYSLGSVILFILSGKSPWTNKLLIRSKSEIHKNPPRPQWPVVPDGVCNFIERCWSPRMPRNRPTSLEVLSFSRDRLQQLLQPIPDSDINVVLFGAVGCGKSSLINLLADEPIAPVSTSMQHCTKRPQSYRISIGERSFRLWDTMGFSLPQDDMSHLSPYEQAHDLLRNLPDGVHLILLCARKDEIFSLFGSLYWLINDFFFGGRAPVAFVVTHFDIPEQSDEARDRNAGDITSRTGIPVQSIHHACTTTALTGCDNSRQTLKALLAKSISSTPLRLNLSSHEAASLDIATHCRLSKSDAAALVERFSEPRNMVEDDHEEPRGSF